MKINAHTRVTFPGGRVADQARIIFCDKSPLDANQVMVITDSTPFHPLDYNWPDQPSDRGFMKFEDIIFPIHSCLIAAVNKETGVFLIDQQIKELKIKRDNLDWYFVVAHFIESSSIKRNDYEFIVGKTVDLQVDAHYRTQLSQSHTACHLSALALNKCLTKMWKKTADYQDGLGSPDFDKEAIVQSKVNENNSCEFYRCGKSLRKKFDCQPLLQADTLQTIEKEVNQLLLNWCSQKLKITIDPTESFLYEMRNWRCGYLDNKEAIIPCGGTHVQVIHPNDKVIVSLKKENDQELTMTSTFAAG